MPTGDCDSKGAFGAFLAENFIERKMVMLICLSIFDRKRGGFEVSLALKK